MRALQRMFWRDLWHLRSQALAAALVVASGVAAFVAMQGTSRSLEAARDEHYAATRFADLFVSLKRAPDGLAARLAEVPGIAGVRSRLVEEVILDVPGLAEPATGRLISIPSRRQPMLNDLVLRAGRWVDPGVADEVLASEAFAAANGLAVGDSVGAILNGRWQRLRIVGIALSSEYVIEIGGGSLFPDNRRFGVLWMGREAMGPAFDLDGAFNDAVFGLSAGADAAAATAAIDALLAPYGGLGAYGRDEQLSHRFLSDEIAQNRVSATYVPGIFLAVAAFLLHIVLTRLVDLQRTEIALLKAIGYGSRTVGRHYLKLALATAVGGGVIGTAVGVWLGDAMAAMYLEYYRLPGLVFRVSLDLLALAFAITVAAAGAGALAAVGRAAALPPAEAMRPEGPPMFRAGLLERSGVRALLPPALRMIVRNLTRRPWKAILSTLGIACAVGILVVGGFFLDAIDTLMATQFEVVQRDDVTVRFNNPRPAAVRHEVARLPGVLRVEPFRSVPARLRFEQRSKRLELTGVEPGGELRRLVDRDLVPVALPPEGLVLTTKLAELLGAAVGDRVIVEVLEGERPVRELAVTAVVDEPVGAAAYLSLAALHRLLREEGAISGAWLKVDSSREAALYARLKATPGVAAVAIRGAMLRSFREILDRSVRFSTIANGIFACIIAFGLVYNGARIALSERGRELASLRVIGFRRHEVATILLGEQALLTLAAVPLGFLLGYAVCALLAARLDTEAYRIPLVVETTTFFYAFAIVVLASLASGLVVARRIAGLDLVAVLKTRE